jgi:hypothetical protein
MEFVFPKLVLELPVCVCVCVCVCACVCVSADGGPSARVKLTAAVVMVREL